MAAYRRIYDSRHLPADCQEPGSAPEPNDRQPSMGYLHLYDPQTATVSQSAAQNRRPLIGQLADVICSRRMSDQQASITLADVTD